MRERWDAIHGLRMEGDYAGARAVAESTIATLRADGVDDFRLPSTETILRTILAIERMGERERDRLAWAESMLDSTLIYYGSDEIAAAARAAEQVVEIRRGVLGDDHIEVAEARIYHSVLLEEESRYEDSESAARAALSRLLDEPVPNLWAVEAALLALAVAQERQGKVAETEPLYREHLRMSEALYADNDEELAISLNNLADNLTNQGKYGESLEYFRQALALRRRHESEVPEVVVQGLANVATVHFHLEDYDSARIYDELAIEVRDRYDVHRPTMEKGVYRTLAAVYQLTGRAQEALAHYEQALEILRGLYGDSHAEIADVLTERSHAYMRCGDVQSARADLTTALRMYAAVVDSGHPRWIAARISAADLSWAEGDYEGALRQYEELRDRYEKSRRAHGIWSFQAVNFSPYAMMAACRLRLGHESDVWPDFERSRGRIVEDLLAAKGLPIDATLDAENVQQHLGEREAVIGWLQALPMQPSSAAWGFVMRSRGPVRWIPLPADTAYVPESPEVRLAGAIRDRADYRALGEEVWKRRLEPLERHLEGVDHVIVIPTAEVVGLPLDVVRPRSDSDAGARRYSYVASGTVLAWLRSRASSMAGRPVLALADPDFGTAPSTSPLPPLTRSRGEIEGLMAAAPPGSVFLTGARATESELATLERNGGLRRFGLVHLATHAVVDPIRPAHSFLALAHVSGTSPFLAAVRGEGAMADGRLTAGEIAERWNLDAELVVLSACETAVGPKLLGEGFLGLSHVILETGARSVLVSLWPVDDEATVVLMQSFYRHLFGDSPSPSRALEAARRDLRQERNVFGARRFDHPYFWTAFVLVGGSA